MNIIASIIAIATFVSWGYFLLERTWKIADDLDNISLLSIIPVAIAIWLSLYISEIL